LTKEALALPVSSAMLSAMGAAWLGAIAAVIVAVPVAARLVQQMMTAGSPWKRRQRRDLACLRMAEWLAADNSHGYPDHYGRYLEHFLGGRAWQDGWGTDGWERADRPDTFG
jgi:hypothetical protein